MSTEDEDRTGLVPSQSAALIRGGGSGLVKRGVQDLLARAEAGEWLARGLALWGYEELGTDDAKVVAEKKRRGEAAECFRRGLELDPTNPVLQFCLGCAYFVDSESDGDYERADSCWQKAAEQGEVNARLHLDAFNGDAETQLFVGYQWGHNKSYGAISWAQAAEWFRTAAEQGLAEAQHNLGCYYRDGKGVRRSHEQAAFWFRKAGESLWFK